jgi:TonB family protein
MIGGQALAFDNLLSWSAQILLVVLVAASVPAILRLSVAKARLAYWQMVLLSCLYLPFAHPWVHETIIFSQVASMPVSAIVRTTPGVSVEMPASSWVMLVVAAGCLARFLWLLSGFWRMHRFRRNSTELHPSSSWSAEADIRISHDVQSPVTFAYWRPVVLLPRTFTALDEATREAILCHEILHVRRKDWLFTLAEELVRTALWFHPAIWWVLGEIQLSREQSVDKEVIDMTRSPDEYVDALLAIAGARPQADLASAPLFLRKRHLKQRVVSILKEVHMSKMRSFSALAASLIVLAGSCWFVTNAIPLYGAPQTVSDSAGVAVDMNGAQLMHRNSVAYPPLALATRVEGTVTAQVKLDGKGNVVDAGIVSGPDELRKAVLQSVLNWHFAKEYANATRQVSIRFELPKAGADAPAVATSEIVNPLVGGQIQVRRAGDFRPPAPPAPSGTVPVFTGLEFAGSDQVRGELSALLPMHPGDPVTPEIAQRTSTAVHEYDEHLQASFRQVSPTEMKITIVPAPGAVGVLAAPAPSDRPIQVGGNVAQANLVTKVNPAYPPRAKEARVQGVVQFETTIGTDGRIENLHLLSGPPLLVQAAMQAVQQWIYRPTLLNGNPVRVLTTIDVNFTLTE